MQEESCLQKLNLDDRAEFWASLALRHAKNIGIRSSARLVQYYGSALNAINNIDTWEDTKIHNSKASNIYNASWYDDALNEWNDANKVNGEIILWTDYRYPSQLKQLIDAPLFFYVKGNTSLLLNICIAIVGSRDYSIDGAKKAREIAKNLSESGITVVSGLAKGIDRNAHIGAIQAIGSTIGVLGSGIEIIYPKENKDIFQLLQENGLIISEFSPFCKPDSRNFPIRNRLISGLSLGVLIVEASLKSGSLITARTALEQNRNVYAIPNLSNNSEGCQLLIEDGALAVQSHEDILLDLPSFRTIMEMSLKVSRVEQDISQLNLLNPPKKHNPALNPPQIEDPIIIIQAPKEPKKNLKKMDSPKQQEKIVANKKAELHKVANLNFAKDSPESIIIALLQQAESLHIDRIIELSKLSSSKINSSLTILEIQKIVKRAAGSHFSLNNYE